MRKLVGPSARFSPSLSKDVRSGLSQQYLSDLERGKLKPTVVTLYELAQALGVSHVELVRPD